MNVTRRYGMRWDDFLTENPTFFLFLCFTLIDILIWNADTLTKTIHLPTLVNRLRSSFLRSGGQLLHLSPLIPSRAIYVLQQKLSKMKQFKPPN